MAPRSLWLALLSLALVAGAAADSTSIPKGIIVLDGRPAPALALRDMDGKEQRLEGLRGHWVFVHFWATWCGPCRREMPTIPRMVADLGDSWRVLLVNTAESDDEVFAFLAGVAPELNSLLDRDGSVTARWQPRGLPSTFLVDPKGRLRYLALGGRAWDDPAYGAFLRGLASRPDSFK